MNQDDVPKVDSININLDKCPTWNQVIHALVDRSEVNSEGGIDLPMIIYPQLLPTMKYSVGQFVRIN